MLFGAVTRGENTLQQVKTAVCKETLKLFRAERGRDESHQSRCLLQDLPPDPSNYSSNSIYRVHSQPLFSKIRFNITFLPTYDNFYDFCNYYRACAICTAYL